MTNNIDLPSNSNTIHGSFTTGFLMGAMVGGAGLFLFATDEGKRIRQKINQEWLEAQEKMLEEGVIDEKVENFAGMIKKIVLNIAEDVEKVEKNLTSEKKNEKKSQKKSRTVGEKKSLQSKKTLMFRGV